MPLVLRGDDAPRDIEDAFGIADGRAAVFLDDEAHRAKGREDWTRSRGLSMRVVSLFFGPEKGEGTSGGLTRLERYRPELSNDLATNPAAHAHGEVYQGPSPDRLQKLLNLL